MQRADLSAAERQSVTSMTVTTLKSLHNDVNFNLFSRPLMQLEIWMLVNLLYLIKKHLVDSMKVLPLLTVEDHYWVIYFEALDLIVACIENCFD